jgi:hypothetical protein
MIVQLLLLYHVSLSKLLLNGRMSDLATGMALALCAKCSRMNQYYYCSVCDKSIHWFCSKVDAKANETLGMVSISGAVLVNGFP